MRITLASTSQYKVISGLRVSQPIFLSMFVGSEVSRSFCAILGDILTKLWALGLCLASQCTPGSHSSPRPWKAPWDQRSYNFGTYPISSDHQAPYTLSVPGRNLSLFLLFLKAFSSVTFSLRQWLLSSMSPGIYRGKKKICLEVVSAISS